MILIKQNGAIVSRSKNLRGLRDYARKIAPSFIRIVQTKTGATVEITFSNNASCKFNAGCFSLMVSNFSKWRNFKSATISTKGL